MNPGSIVRCRNRDWVLLPSDDPEVDLLRPLTGATDEVVAVHKRLADLIGYTLNEERLHSATFPLPKSDDLADAASAYLLWQAARLTLREGATPFRSLGRISIRPRIYQFVPLLMALRLDPVRLLIADDVGVGKTIEVLLIARELLDRGEIKRMCVLCPPYLCEQWQRELSEKFNLDSVIVRSGTIGQLERRKIGTDSIYRYYPIQVASIDFLKTDRNKNQFLLDCPDLVIVDEAHGSATTFDKNQGQHQRHALIRQIAFKEKQHLILLTATPHSGVETAFRSLLSLVRSDFAELNTSTLAEAERIELARHFVQRTRRDIENDWEGDHCFPKRVPEDAPYRLSDEYKSLFRVTYEFCSEMVQAGHGLNRRQQRVRYWGALALLRCVMSSPAAAVAALESRHESLTEIDDDPDFRPFVFESADDRTDDEQPTPPVESAEATMKESEKKRLRDLSALAAKLINSHADSKLSECAKIVSTLLREGFHPIVWCRYIATADYLAAGLQSALRSEHPGISAVSITGRTADEERRTRVGELSTEPCRVLVATDCLSEGINLQGAFDAVLHYDLPWNPNRLEQREGRVDRFGGAKIVKAIRYFSPDSAVDGVVLNVLLNKAREIHKALGTHVPVPEESESVTEALLNALFLQGQPQTPDDRQQLLDFGQDDESVTELHRQWDLNAEREKSNRSRFAQRALKPAEVRDELEATDAVLGDPSAVRDFVLSAAQRLGLYIAKNKQANVFTMAVGPNAVVTLPRAIAEALPPPAIGQWCISFISPTPQGAEYLGRNHRFVVAVARFLMEEALTKGGAAAATRCGVLRTRTVKRPTTVYLLRVRYLLNQPDRHPLLSEEVIVTGYSESATGGTPVWLTPEEALELLAKAQPDANLNLAEKQQLVAAALSIWPRHESEIHSQIDNRAAELEKSHKRVRKAVSLRVRQLAVTPQYPPDLLGILVLQPVD